MPHSAKPTKCISPTFVEIKDLPAPIIQAIRFFQPYAEQQTYDTKDGAEGLCLEASDEFIHILIGCGVKPGRGRKFLREYIFDPQNDKERKRMLTEKYEFPFDPDGCAFHFVVKINEVVIDWTARQFGDKNPFPAIWREE